MRAFLRLTLSVLVISVISSENTCSAGLLSGLANKAKSAASSIKNTAVGTATNLKNKATKSIENKVANVKGKVSNTVSNVSEQVSSTVSNAAKKGEQIAGAGEKALNDALSIIGGETPNEEETDDIVLDNSETVSTNELLLDDVETPSDETMLLLDDKSVEVSEPAVTEDLLESDVSSEFSPEVVNHVESLFPAIESVSAGLMLDLSGKGLNDEAMAYIAMVKIPMLAEQKVEKITLNLSNNKATHEGFGTLLESLSSNPKLVSILDFSGNNIGDEGAMLIAEKCEKLVMLNSIILSNCGMSGDGVLGLLSAIASIKDGIFQRLDLSKNNIDPSYVSLILDQIKLFKEGTFEDGIDLTGLSKESLPQEVEIPDNVFF